MFILFWTGFCNTILYYTLHFDTDIDKFIFTFLLVDLFIAAIACFLRDIDKNYHIIQKLCDQFNEHLAKRDKIIEATRKGFAFEKVKASHFCIIYFKMIGIKKQVEKAQQDLINFGVDKEIVENDEKLLKFLQELGQDKYQIKVNEKEKKFVFIKK